MFKVPRRMERREKPESLNWKCRILLGAIREVEIKMIKRKLGID